ncbi:MAG: hypothetical protein ACYC0Q_04505 [Eubacteriales bacterium]
MRKKQGPALLIFCVLLFAAGCGGSGKGVVPQDKTEGKKDSAKVLISPCALLTKVEAEAALGEQVKEPESRDTKNPLGQKICLYSPVSDKSENFIQLSLVQNEGMTNTLREQGYNVEQLYKETKENLAEVKPVSGIGDEAFWGTNGLHILKGNVYLNISVGNTSKPENLELAKDLARKAVDRL